MVGSNQKNIERRVFTSFLKDGSLEAFTGIFLLVLGLSVLLSRYAFGDLQSAAIALASALILLAVIFLIRKFVVIPRLGRVKFLAERRRKVSKLMIIPTIALIAGIIVSFIFADNTSTGHIIVSQIPISLSPLILFTAAAYFLDIKRLYIYAVIVAAIMPLGKYFETILVSRATLPGIMLATAIISFFISAVIFVTFLRKYPVEEHH